MMIESKPEATKNLPERETVPMEASDPRQEDIPFYVVPPPPIPGETGWSIVPW
jgi:hypothetical protein